MASPPAWGTPQHAGDLPGRPGDLWGSTLPPLDAFSSPAAPPPEAFGAVPPVPPPDYGPAAPHESFSGPVPPPPYINQAAPPEPYPMAAAGIAPSPPYVSTPPPSYVSPPPPAGTRPLPGGGQAVPPNARPHPLPGGLNPNEPWLVQSKKQRRFPTALVLTVIGALIVAGGGTYGIYTVASGDDTPKTATTGIADSVFASAPGATTDGSQQSVNDVAAVGNTVVAAGYEHGFARSWPRFLVSQDAGLSWKVAEIKTEPGANAGGAIPLSLVGTSGAWLALGQTSDRMAAWRSTDGRSWVKVKDGTSTFRTTDHLRQIARGAQAYVAVGYQQQGDKSALPVIWLSPDGTSWSRVDGGKLKLPVKGGSVARLHYAAAAGDAVLVSGEIRKSGKKSSDADSIAGLWRSADGGRTWTSVAPPQADDAFGDVHLAATPAGFFALRKAKDGDARKGLVSSSADGTSWRTRGSFPLGGGESENFQRVAGGDQGLAVLVTVPGNRVAAYRSTDGVTWQRATDLGDTKGRTINGLAVTQGGAAIVGGVRQGADQNFYLNRIDVTGGSNEVDLTKVRNAVNPDRSLQALVTAAGQTVVVGGTNGDAAAWTSPDGATWRRSDTSGLSGPGGQVFTGVANGPQGWLAIGSDGSKPLLAILASGSSWRRLDSPAFTPAAGKTLTLGSVVSGPKGYVIVGSESTGTSESSAVAWHSTDLVAWTRADDQGIKAEQNAWHRMLDVAAITSGYVAVGETIDPKAPAAKRSRPEIWTSPDGLKWTAQRSSLPERMENSRLTHVAANGQIVTALGQGYALNEGHRTFALTSDDSGLTWSALRLPLPTGPARPAEVSITSVTTKSTGFAAVGSTEADGDENVVLWTSADGRTWQPVAPQGPALSGDGVQRITDVALVGNKLLGVGLTADSTAQHTTLWYGPAG